MPKHIQKPATQVQLRGINRVVTEATEQAIAKFCLRRSGAQRVHRRKKELAEAVREAIATSLKDLSVPNEFGCEDIPSEWGYHSGYTPKDLDVQRRRLHTSFSDIGSFNQELFARITAGQVKLPAGAEGWFAIPNRVKHPRIFGETYIEALLKMLDVVRKTNKGRFINYREGMLDGDRIRCSDHTQNSWTELVAAQGSPDILIVPAQFGFRHRGRSVRRARELITDTTDEFALGAFATAIMILTHPERFQHEDDLWVDGAGDEFDDRGSATPFDNAPYFYFRVREGKICFDADHIACLTSNRGSASGFLLPDLSASSS